MEFRAQLPSLFTQILVTNIKITQVSNKQTLSNP